MMKKYLILSLMIVISSHLFSQQKYTISGFINDNQNGESLIGVNVLIKEKLVGTTSNTFGFIVLPYQKVLMKFRLLISVLKP